MNTAYRQNADQHSISHRNPANLKATSGRALNIIASLLNNYHSSTAIELRDGQKLHNDPKTRCALVLKQLRVLAGFRHFSPSTWLSGHPRYLRPVQSPSLWSDKAKPTPIATDRKYSLN